MATVIRIKRRLEEEPSENLTLNCKRRKVDVGSQEDVKPISFEYAGTLHSQDEHVTTLLEKTTREKLKEHYKQPNVDILNRIKVQKQKEYKEIRYRILNCFRLQECDKDESTSKQSEVIVYDIEINDASYNDTEGESEANYVYDIYRSTLEDCDYIYEPINNTEQDFDEGNLVGFSYDYDSEDSNAENNYNNDYNYSDEESLDTYIKGMGLDSDSESDVYYDESDDYYYSKYSKVSKSNNLDDDDASLDEGDIDEDDVATHGMFIARLKAKMDTSF